MKQISSLSLIRSCKKKNNIVNLLAKFLQLLFRNLYRKPTGKKKKKSITPLSEAFKNIRCYGVSVVWFTLGVPVMENAADIFPVKIYRAHSPKNNVPQFDRKM